jgi:hypothetical protein
MPLGGVRKRILAVKAANTPTAFTGGLAVSLATFIGSGGGEVARSETRRRLAMEVGWPLTTPRASKSLRGRPTTVVQRPVAYPGTSQGLLP